MGPKSKFNMNFQSIPEGTPQTIPCASKKEEEPHIADFKPN